MTEETCPMCGQPAQLTPLQTRGKSPIQNVADWLRRADGWTRVEDALPKQGKRVLFANAAGVNEGYWTPQGWYLTFARPDTGYPIAGISHWQPMPPPPAD